MLTITDALEKEEESNNGVLRVKEAMFASKMEKELYIVLFGIKN